MLDEPPTVVEEIEDDINPHLSQKSNRSHGIPTTSTLKTENYYQKYEAFKIRVSSVNFKSSKSLLISFFPMNEIKSKYRLLSVHMRLIGQIIINNQKRMENLHRNLIVNGLEEPSEMVGEFLGNSQVTLNMI